MKLIFNIFIFGLIAIAINRCNSDKNSTRSIIIEINNAEQTIDINAIFDSSDIEIIPLETNENSIFKSLSNLKLFEDKIYIIARKENPLVICFDNTGKFLYSIDNFGKGPNEYGYLYDLNINPFNGYLELLDPQGKLISYNLHTDEFVSSYDLANPISNFFFNSNILQLYYNGKLRNILLSDGGNSKEISGFPEFDHIFIPFLLEAENKIAGIIKDPSDIITTEFYENLSLCNKRVLQSWDPNDNQLLITFKID